MVKLKNVTFDVEDWNSEYAKRYLVSTILQSLFLVLGFCGNMIVFVIYTTRMKSKNDDRYFIPFLAGVDLLGCLVSTTLILLNNNLPYKYPNSAICKSLNVMACGLIVASVFLLFVISVQRYQKICRPFGFQMTLHFKRKVVALVFTLAIAFAFPTIFLTEKIEVLHPVTNITGYRCGPVPNTEQIGETHLGILITAELTSVICMSILYGFVAYTLVTKLKPSRKINKTEIVSRTTHFEITSNDTKTTRVTDNTTKMDDFDSNVWDHTTIDAKKGKTRSGKHYSMMFMSISLVSILCLLPPWVFVLLETKNKAFWNNLTYQETQGYVIIRGLFVLNFVVNPFIYGYFDSKFRNNVAQIFASIFNLKFNKFKMPHRLPEQQWT